MNLRGEFISFFSNRHVLAVALGINALLFIIPASVLRAKEVPLPDNKEECEAMGCTEWVEEPSGEGICVYSPAKPRECPYCCINDVWTPELDNRCLYECINGEWKQMTTPDGCSSPAGTEAKTYFNSSCNQHDDCYQLCSQVDRSVCDDTFLINMMKQCDNSATIASSGMTQDECYDWAQQYYDSVHDFGWLFFALAKSCCGRTAVCDWQSTGNHY